MIRKAGTISGFMMRWVTEEGICLVLVWAVYGVDPLMRLQCLIYSALRCWLYRRQSFLASGVDPEAMEWLLELDERLRLGDSPGYALKTFSESRPLPSESLDIRMNAMTGLWSLMVRQLEREVDFDYRGFHLLVLLCQQERHWKRQIQQILERSRIQLGLMRLIPLLMILLLARPAPGHFLILSLSLWLHLLADGLAVSMTKEWA